MMAEVEDIEKYYSENKEDNKKAEKLISKDENEVLFYGNDLEYLRHHKRTKRNMEEVLDEILV
jgi:hypothetical protein